MSSPRLDVCAKKPNDATLPESDVDGRRIGRPEFERGGAVAPRVA